VSTRLKAVTLAGPAGALEAILHEREPGPPAVAALVCHPHAMHGGTMHNKVTHRVASVLHDLGAAALRFNFRGAGRSEGRFDRGEGELEDARAALAWLGHRYPDARLWVAGFSFGSWIAARLAASEPGVVRLILVAPPVQQSSFEVLRRCPVPKLVLQGTRDDICPLEALLLEFPGWMEPRRLIPVSEATHFFDRQLGVLGELLAGAIGEIARPTPR